MEILACVKAVRVAVSQFCNNPSNSNHEYLKHQLEMLETVSGRFESLKPLHPNELATCECLSCLVDIVSNRSTKPAQILQCLQIFSNLARDPELCKMMHESFNLEHTLVAILNVYGNAVSEPLTQVCLQLLQRVTYGHRISFHEGFVDDLLKYLIKHILAKESFIIQPCLGVLANLCRENFPIQARIKSLDNVRKLYKTICSYFSGDLTSAVFAVSIFTSLCLNEELGDEVFLNNQNLKEVFQLVFNALVNGDAKDARFYAVDLLQELLRNPRLQQTLEEYPKLSKNIEETLNLISSSSASSVTKIFELLISFCSLASVRACMCRLLFKGPLPSQSEIASSLNRPPRPELCPLVAVACWAAQPVTTGTRASLSALDFFKEMFEEVLCQGDQRTEKFTSLVMLPVLVQILREPLSPTTPYLKDSCQRLSGALRLITVLCTDDEGKTSVAAALKTEDFKSLLQFQLSANKALHKSASARKGLDDVQDWEGAGVEVVLLCMQLMSKIRRCVQGLEDLFLQLLQDNEMVPFLAKGCTSKERDLVQISLQLTCLGSTLENFPDVILGDAVAAANASLAATAAAATKPSDMTMDVSCSSSMPSFASENKENMPLRPRSMGDLSLQTGDHSVQALIDKMHSSIELKDLKTADIIEIYEHRLQSHQTKEDHLQDLLEAKTMALTQADRLIAQYRSRQARHGAEAHKMRCLFQEAERKNEGLLQEMNDLKLEKDRLRNDFDLLKHENNQLELRALELEELKVTHSELCHKCEQLETALTRQQQELKTTQEMHEILQKHYESLKHQHDVASEQLKKLEEERKQLSRALKDAEAKYMETTMSLQALTDKHKHVVKDREELEHEKETLEKVVDKLRSNISNIEHTNKELTHKVKTYERRIQEQEDSLKKCQDRVAYLEAEVNKHEHIASLIQKLSSGQDILGTAQTKK